MVLSILLGHELDMVGALDYAVDLDICSSLQYSRPAAQTGRCTDRLKKAFREGGNRSEGIRRKEGDFAKIKKVAAKDEGTEKVSL